MVKMELVVTVTNFQYSEELKDTQSEVYHDFEEHFRKEVRTQGTELSLRGPPGPPRWWLTPPFGFADQEDLREHPRLRGLEDHQPQVRRSRRSWGEGEVGGGLPFGPL